MLACFNGNRKSQTARQPKYTVQCKYKELPFAVREQVLSSLVTTSIQDVSRKIYHWGLERMTPQFLSITPDADGAHVLYMHRYVRSSLFTKKPILLDYGSRVQSWQLEPKPGALRRTRVEELLRHKATGMIVVPHEVTDGRLLFAEVKQRQSRIEQKFEKLDYEAPLCGQFGADPNAFELIKVRRLIKRHVRAGFPSDSVTESLNAGVRLGPLEDPAALCGAVKKRKAPCRSALPTEVSGRRITLPK